MRSFGVVVALGGVAVGLHGCGSSGSSSSPTSPCMNKQVDLVTQSVQGSSNGNLSIQLDVKGLPPTVAVFLDNPINIGAAGDYSLKLDLEKFNVRFDTTDTFEVTDFLTSPVKATVAQTLIFNAANNELVVASEIDVDALGRQLPIKRSCSVSSIKGMPSLKNITDVFDEVKKALQSSIQCKGTNGLYDDWRAIPAAIPVATPMIVTMDMKMDREYLWHEVLLGLNGHMAHPLALPPLPQPIGNVTVQSITANVNLLLNVTAATKEGPSAEDMDYSTLRSVACTKSSPVAFQDMKQHLLAHRMRAQAMVALIGSMQKHVGEFITV